MWFPKTCPLFGRRDVRVKNNGVTRRFYSATSAARNTCKERWSTTLSLLPRWDWLFCALCRTVQKNIRTGRKKKCVCQHSGKNKIRRLDKTQDHFPPCGLGAAHSRHPVITAGLQEQDSLMGRWDSGEAAGINALAAITTILPPPSPCGLNYSCPGLWLGHTDVKTILPLSWQPKAPLLTKVESSYYSVSCTRSLSVRVVECLWCSEDNNHIYQLSLFVAADITSMDIFCVFHSCFKHFNLYILLTNTL